MNKKRNMVLTIRLVFGIVLLTILGLSAVMFQVKVAYFLLILLGVFMIGATLEISEQMVYRDPMSQIGNGQAAVRFTLKKSREGKLCEYDGLFMSSSGYSYFIEKYGIDLMEKLIYNLSQELMKKLGRENFIGRLGGDNFVVFVKKELTQPLIDELVNKEVTVEYEGKTYRITLRMCIGYYHIQPGDDYTEVMSSIYSAHNLSMRYRTQNVVEYTDDLRDISRKEKSVIEEIREALKNGEIVPAYQPKIDVSTNEMCGAEALVRWVKNGQVVPPDEYIPVLEKYSCISELDFYILERVCMDISEWKQKGLQPVRISTNYSRMHLDEIDFSDRIIEIIRKYNIEGSFLEAELTESVGYENNQAFAEFIWEMHNEGIAVSIDDFGTGYSSLSMLREIKADVVKMDKSFLYSLSTCEKAEFLSNVIHMIKVLKKDVICEGVETLEQLNFLKYAGCDKVQGFLFDKALFKAEFEERMLAPSYKI